MRYLALTLPGGSVINPPTGSGIPSGGLGTVNSVMQNALTIILIGVVVIVLIMLVWAGVQWILSGGDKSKIAAARARLTWAIIGLVIALLSFAIVDIIGHFFGVNLLNINASTA